MKIVKIKPESFENKELDIIIDYLKNEKVIVYPTDTVYGLGCLATSEKGIEKINKIKNRQQAKPFIVLIDSIDMAEKYANINEKTKKYLTNTWPGPITVIMESKGVLPKSVTAGQDSIAMRLPKNKFLITMLNRIKVPLISTSSNIVGDPPAQKLENIDAYYKYEKPDMIIDAGDQGTKKPSQIIDVREINNIILLRS